MGNILLIEDNMTSYSNYTKIFQSLEYNPKIVSNLSDAFEATELIEFDIIILDLRLDEEIPPDESINKTINNIPQLKQQSDAEIIIITAFGDEEKAAEAIQKGAHSFVEKKDNYWTELKRTIHLILSEIELDRKVQQNGGFVFGDDTGRDVIIGTSLKMRNLYKKIVKIADIVNGRSNIFISGETGTGKGLVASAFHATVARPSKNFISVNCASIPENLIESQLFGHKRGSFTGADTDHQGYLESADGGMLFLDELGHLVRSNQAKLLKILDERIFTPLGGKEEIEVDVVIVSATDQDINCLFEPALINRITEIPIIIPPLRERGGEDILRIANFFLKKYCQQHQKLVKGIHAEANEILCKYEWPGNVRQLENVIKRCVFHKKTPYLLPNTLREAIKTHDYSTKRSYDENVLVAEYVGEHTTEMGWEYINPSGSFSLSHLPNELDIKEELEEHKKERVRQALKKAQGNQREAAEIINMKKSTINRIVKKYLLSQNWD